MLPQIPLHSSLASLTGTPLPSALDTAQSARLGHPFVTPPQTANFAAVFAADMPRLQSIPTGDEPNPAQVETGVPDEQDEGEPSKLAHKQTESDGTPHKDIAPATDPQLKGDAGAHPAPAPKLGDALPATAQAIGGNQNATVPAKGLDNPQPSGAIETAAPAIVKPAPDPWQVAVLPKDTVPNVASAASLDEVGAPPPHTKDPKTASPPANAALQTAGDARLQNAQQSAPVPFESRLVAEFAVPPEKQESKLTARFAETTAQPKQNVAPMPVQPVAKSPQATPLDGSAADMPGTRSTGTGPISIPTPQQSEQRFTGAIPAPQPNPLASTPPPAATPNIIVGAPEQKLQATAPPQPIANATIATTSLVPPSGTGVPPLNVPQNTAASGLLPKQQIGQNASIAVKAPAPGAERRIAARSEPVAPPVTQVTAPPIEIPKLAAPLVPWQAISLAPTDQPLSKDSLAIDPISGEPRLSSLAATTSATGPIQRPELPPQIARQLAEAIQQNPNRPVEITLKPQELGAVRLSVQQAEMGIIVNLTAERPETLELMRRHIDQLGQDFQAMGYANIAFSFAGGETGADAQSDDTPTHQAAETEDASAVPAAHIHLATGTTGGVDLRL